MILGRLLSNVLQKSITNTPALTKEAGLPSTKSLIQSSFNLFWNATAVRTKMRYYFPRPNERQRIRKSGWATRMSTLGGRKIIWRRILKRKMFLTH